MNIPFAILGFGNCSRVTSALLIHLPKRIHFSSLSSFWEMTKNSNLLFAAIGREERFYVVKPLRGFLFASPLTYLQKYSYIRCTHVAVICDRL